MKTYIHRLVCLSIASFALLSGHVQGALFIDFESPNYTTGKLRNQKLWTSGAANENSVNVTSGLGIGGSNGAALSAPTANYTITYNPSITELAGFDGSSSLVEYEYYFRFLDAPNPSTSNAVATFNLGYASSTANDFASRVIIFGTGTLSYNNGTTSITIPNYVTSTADWVKISGQLNYGSKTYSLYIDDVQISAALNFATSNVTTAQFRLQNAYPGAAQDYVGVVFDNISMNVVPEPSVAWLVVLGCLVLMVGKNRSGKRNTCITKK